ncbi:hypothetical protein F5X98DRAFT_350199 [Xylaria grammica]|nr:hypothetical protein F5X98DRAFT_350199 [Xylaria grammica]
MAILSASFGLKLLAAAVFLCYPSKATTTTTDPLYVPNGDFECGVTPWTVQAPDTAASYFVGAPGHATSNSFQVHFTPPSRGAELGVSARIISAPVSVQPNVPYQLTFWTYFDNGDAGFIGVQFNDVPVYTIDARDHGYGGDFTLNTVNYTPTTSTVTIKFEFLYGTVASLDRIDSVVFAPL